MTRRFQLDHRWLFLFGYFFYLGSPVIVGYSEAFTGLPGVDIFQEAFASLPDTQVKIYLMVSACWLPAFFAGDWLVANLARGFPPPRRFPPDSSSRSLWIVAMTLFGVMLIFAFLARQSLLGGYASYDVGARGKLSTLLMIASFFWVYDRVTNQRHNMLLSVVIGATALMLLSMGGRMYVFHLFMVIVVFKTSLSERRWGLHKVVLFLMLGVVAGSVVGLLRMGVKPGFWFGMYSFFAEPAFTWFSVMTYLSNNEVSAFQWPANFFSSFLNLVPNTIFKVKPYLVSLESMADGYRNPLGADSLWTNLVINFGSIGSIFFVFMTGALLAFLKKMAGLRRFWAAYYLMVCGMIPFQFFRDGFYILHKQLLFNFLLFPALVLILLQLLVFLRKTLPHHIQDAHGKKGRTAAT
jgi:uncharacterized membrane protein